MKVIRKMRPLGAAENAPQNLRACLRSDEGQALIELAITVPVFLILLTGMFSVAMAMYSYEKLGEAVFVGAEEIQNARAAPTTIVVSGDPCQSAESLVASSLPTWASGSLTYSVSITDSSGTAHTLGPVAASAFTCTGFYADLGENEPATLTVNYTYQWLPIYRFSLGTGTLSQSRTVLVE